MNEKNYAFEPLMAVDSLGRRLADRTNAPEEKKNRFVGVFYFLWLGETGRHAPLDVSKITAKDPMAGYKPDSDVWGGIGTYHHWGEPFYGSYYSNDEWVVRRHMKLLTLAGVDFLFFDTTNGPTYDHNAKMVMRIPRKNWNAFVWKTSFCGIFCSPWKGCEAQGQVRSHPSSPERVPGICHV